MYCIQTFFGFLYIFYIYKAPKLVVMEDGRGVYSGDEGDGW